MTSFGKKKKKKKKTKNTELNCAFKEPSNRIHSSMQKICYESLAEAHAYNYPVRADHSAASV